MKKLLFSLALMATFSFTAIAQDNPDPKDDMHEGFSQMMEELAKAMEGMESQMGDMHMFMDTMLVFGMEMMPSEEQLERLGEMEGLQNLEQLEGLEQLEQLGEGGTMNFGELFGILEQQMSQLSKQDWSELERFFQDYGQKFEKMAPKLEEKSKGLRKI